MDCLLLTVTSLSIPAFYVVMLYVFDYHGTNRDSPISIRKRTHAVIFASAVSVLVTVCLLSFQPSESSVLSQLGMRSDGLLMAAVLPLLLTALLFLGPIAMVIYDKSYMHLIDLQDPQFVRNIITAPITEELAFRACSSSLLLHCLHWKWVCVVVPAAFGLCHLHHVIDKHTNGYTWTQALMIVALQVSYTFIFGVYATFLFIRTGHLISSILSHQFCNLMGLPQFMEIFEYKETSTRIVLSSAFVIGLLAWICTIGPFTQPHLYQNYVFV